MSDRTVLLQIDLNKEFNMVNHGKMIADLHPDFIKVIQYTHADCISI